MLVSNILNSVLDLIVIFKLFIFPFCIPQMVIGTVKLIFKISTLYPRKNVANL